MTIREIQDKGRPETDILFELWLKSVKASHHFLSDDDILKISEYVPQALKGVPELAVAEEGAAVLGFIGVDGKKIEMLFVSPEYFGRGVGKSLVRYAVERYSVDEVCVNEQNINARRFYERMGFVVYKRSEYDEQGGPFPVLYMRLQDRK